MWWEPPEPLRNKVDNSGAEKALLQSSAEALPLQSMRLRDEQCGSAFDRARPHLCCAELHIVLSLLSCRVPCRVRTPTLT